MPGPALRRGEESSASGVNRELDSTGGGTTLVICMNCAHC
jgi:hypothetical protein